MQLDNLAPSNYNKSSCLCHSSFGDEIDKICDKLARSERK